MRYDRGFSFGSHCYLALAFESSDTQSFPLTPSLFLQIQVARVERAAKECSPCERGAMLRAWLAALHALDAADAEADPSEDAKEKDVFEKADAKKNEKADEESAARAETPTKGGSNQVTHTKYLARSRRTSTRARTRPGPTLTFKKMLRQGCEDEPMAQRYPSAARSWLVHQAGMFSVE